LLHKFDPVFFLILIWRNFFIFQRRNWDFLFLFFVV
jgi:hypothetical protein